MRRRGRARRMIRRLLWLAALGGIVWLGGLLVFANALPRAEPEATGRTDAIVVLTGGSERLASGFDLLRRDLGGKLFISGVYRGVDVRELLRMSRQSPDDIECCIVLGYTADDTEGNAVETAQWMRAEGFRSLRLVTANYHMPRSLVEFRRSLPDAEIVPHPVVPPNVRLDWWFVWPGTAALIVEEYNKYLLASLRARLFGPRVPPDPAPGAAPGQAAARPFAVAVSVASPPSAPS